MMTMIMRPATLSIAAALQLGCSTPAAQLFAEGYVGDRVVRYIWQPTGARGDEAGRLYSLRVRICYQRPDGTETNCTQTVILENVQPLGSY